MRKPALKGSNHKNRPWRTGFCISIIFISIIFYLISGIHVSEPACRSVLTIDQKLLAFLDQVS